MDFTQSSQMFARHLERMPVTLRCAQGLACRTQRSFAEFTLSEANGLRMTARTPPRSRSKQTYGLLPGCEPAGTPGLLVVVPLDHYSLVCLLRWGKEHARFPTVIRPGSRLLAASSRPGARWHRRPRWPGCAWPRCAESRDQRASLLEAA